MEKKNPPVTPLYLFGVTAPFDKGAWILNFKFIFAKIPFFRAFCNKMQTEKLQTEKISLEKTNIKLFRTHSLFIIVIILDRIVNKNSFC